MNFQKLTIFHLDKIPKCSKCGKALDSYSLYIKDEKCPTCIADEISDALMEIVKKQLNKLPEQNISNHSSF